MQYLRSVLCLVLCTMQCAQPCPAVLLCGHYNALDMTYIMTVMADKTGAVKYWGEVEESLPKPRSRHLEITEPKTADYEEPKLHQPSAEHYPPKDE